MERNHFKERCEVQLKALGITQAELAEMLGKPISRLTEALRGDTTPAASNTRVQMAQILNSLCDRKRERMAAELESKREILCPHLVGKLSVILPEDLLYIVTEDGIPVGAWNPQSKTYRELDAAVLPVIGRRVK